MHFALNLLLLLALAALGAFGTALFWIARQDDSHGGRIIGLLVVAIGASAALYLILGRHWF